jgi:phosphate transport system permease protein
MASTLVAPDATREAVRRALTGRKADLRGGLFRLLLLGSLFVALAVLLVLLFDVFRSALPVLSDRGTSFLANGTSSLPARAGIRQGLMGSLVLMGFVAVLSFPLGIAAGVYMEEYAKDTRLSRFINANIRNLAGVPAIVYGILGLAVFVKLLGGATGPEVEGRSLIAGGLTIALMVLPVIIITTAEALRAVPRSIREAGYGVGATQWEVTRSHVLPYAAPGILTGTVLAMARALGETAPLIMVGAVTGFFVTHGTFLEQLQSRFTALPTIVYAWVKKPQDEFQALAAAAIVTLIALIFLINLAAILLRNRYERKW